MKILWLCNLILPAAAQLMGVQASNKEGWLSGVAETVSKNAEISLCICFPVSKEHSGFSKTVGCITYKGFYEDTLHPEEYSTYLETTLEKIYLDFAPDMVHIFGTEFPHTLAMCKVVKKHSGKVLVGIQGVMGELTEHYLDGVPAKVAKRQTFRDVLKKDGLLAQKEKFRLRSLNEQEAVRLSDNVTGRTEFDRQYCVNINPSANYFHLNETLRKEFYEDEWQIEGCEKHSIFFSQGNYPIKGLHYMLEAMPLILNRYPEARLYIAGDSIVNYSSLKDKIKISSYGRYLLELIKKNKLDGKIIFLGNLDAVSMKDRILHSNLFICASTNENSSNSLGEAMLLGVPAISSRVGGIPSIFTEDTDGLMFESGNIKELYECVDKIFSDGDLALKFSKASREHASKTHDADINYRRLIEIYKDICG